MSEKEVKVSAFYKDSVKRAIKSNPATAEINDSGAYFVARELAAVRNESYDVLYEDIEFREAFTVNNPPEGAQSLKVKAYDKKGRSKVISGNAKDLPRADVVVGEHTIEFRQTGVSYGYTTEEIRSAAYVGMPLDARKAQAAMEANEQTNDTIAFFGSAADNLDGLFTFPGIPVSTVPNGASTSPEWSTKTGAEMYADMCSAVDDIYINSKKKHKADRLRLPLAQYTLAECTNMGTGTDLTVLEYFKRNKPGVEVVPCNKCDGAGAGGVDVMVAYQKRYAEVEEPMLFKQYPPQQAGLEFEIPCEAKFGGFHDEYPISVNILDSI
jgi:hypothetical protein